MKSPITVFVTGGTGFVGRNFIRHALEKLPPDAMIYLLARKPVKQVDPRIKILIGDLEHIEKYAGELRLSDYVFHIGALSTFGNDADYDRINFVPTKTIVDLLSESTVLKNFVFLSTIGAVDRAKEDDCSSPLTITHKANPTSKYGQSKYCAEQYIIGSSIPYVIIRPAWVYGRDMRSKSHINVFASMIAEKSFISHLSFPGTVSLVHNDDLCAALVNCIDNPHVIGKTYFGVTESLPLGKIFALIYERIFHSKPIQIPVPRINFLFSRFHSRISLKLSNLFLDYLCARDDRFVRDFHLDHMKGFSGSVGDVTDTNTTCAGYWVITGANSGIGHELARLLRKSGKKLILIDRKTDRLKDFAKDIVLEADLADYEDLKKISETVRDRKIYCLVNNAGVGFRKSTNEIAVDEIMQSVLVNALAPILLTKLLLDAMIENGSVVVNIASSVAYNPLPHMSLYSSTKAMLMNWSESLTYELRNTNRVITFSPSGTDTDFQARAGVKKTDGGKGLLEPSYVAGRIIKAVHKNTPVVILGWKTQLLLFFSKFLPRRWNIAFWGKLFELTR